MLVGSDRRIVFLGGLTGHSVGDWRPRGDDERTVRTRENRAKRLDDVAIVLAVLDEP